MSTPPIRPLNVPPVESSHFATNFIRMAVCELRFPTLFELTESERPPIKFSKALRKHYPTYELLRDVNVQPGGLAQASAHAFRSKKGRWTTTLRAAALTLETSNYDCFDEFEERLKVVIEAASTTIDSEFFTRVGLRYINVLPYRVDEIKSWVNPHLVTPLGDGTFGDVEEHSQSIRGSTTAGGFSFRHGLAKQQSREASEYVLDFDFYREDVPVTETVSIVRDLHDLEFSMFVWSLGPEAKKQLGAVTPKESK